MTKLRNKEMTVSASKRQKDCTTTTANLDDEEPGEMNDCPLFMSGLPSDFSSNPHLMALASLIDDDGASEDKSKSHSKSLRKPIPQRKARVGNFRATGRMQRQKAISSPYPVPEKSPNQRPTVGEVHLFVKMWKL